MNLYETVNLWGKDLYEHLSEVYDSKARYCVIFGSQHYARKVWTNHELRNAQALALQQKEEYILPARFDDTKIPGVRSTINYVDLRNLTPKQFASLVMEKIKGDSVMQNCQLDEPAMPFLGEDSSDVHFMERSPPSAPYMALVLTSMLLCVGFYGPSDGIRVFAEFWTGASPPAVWLVTVGYVCLFLVAPGFLLHYLRNEIGPNSVKGVLLGVGMAFGPWLIVIAGRIIAAFW